MKSEFGIRTPSQSELNKILGVKTRKPRMAKASKANPIANKLAKAKKKKFKGKCNIHRKSSRGQNPHGVSYKEIQTGKMASFTVGNKEYRGLITDRYIGYRDVTFYVPTTRRVYDFISMDDVTTVDTKFARIG